MRLRARPVGGLDRTAKALMIEAFLRDAIRKPLNGLRLLDIGYGNGDIGAHFSNDNDTYGIDVEDRRRPEHIRLARCIGRSELLPFAEHSFDIVISHHVIEHVADHDRHVAEIHRVLKPDGICYLGTPNRSSPLMRGHIGNSMVLPYAKMAPLFERHGFCVEEWYARWLHQPERYHCPVTIGRYLPYSVLHLLRRWFPSQCFLLRPRGP